MQTKTNRQGNMELLRICSMLLIVTHHLVYNSLDWKTSIISGGGGKYIGSFVEAWAITGVNLFFMLSGYFQIKSCVKKIVSTLISVYSYMLVICFTGILTGIYTKSNISMMLKDFILAPHDYWFVEVYLVLCIISPMLNKLIQFILKEDILSFNIFFWGILCGYGFITGSSFIAVNRGYSLIFAAALYIVGGLIRNRNYLGEHYRLLILFPAIINAILFIIVGEMGNDTWIRVTMSYNNPLIVLTAIGIFVGFTKLNIRNRKINGYIQFFSKSTLAVYLLHSTNRVFTVYRSVPIRYLKNNFGSRISYLSVLPFAVIIYVICTLFDTEFQKITNIIENKFGRYMMKGK